MKQEIETLTDLEKADCLTGRMPGGIAIKKSAHGGVRRRFEFPDRDSCYHLMSRTTGGELLFGDEEKEGFCKIMWRMARFSGVEILTYAVMGNHFHLLIRVPKRERFLGRFKDKSGRWDETKLLKHLAILYSRAYLAQLKEEFRVMRARGLDELYELTIQRFLDRFCSLRRFMKELKERFSRWFNKKHARCGTLWQDRYKSILVGDGEALATMASYIDLNPLRAGLVEDPKDYRWCGYAEALGGSKRMKRGLCRSIGVPIDDWEEKGGELYRKMLLADGMEFREVVNGGSKQGSDVAKRRKKKGFDRKKALAALKAGGKLSRAEMLRCRVRYFSDGMVIGNREFVEDVFQSNRDWFGKTRKTGARGLPGTEDGTDALYAMRDLKSQVIE